MAQEPSSQDSMTKDFYFTDFMRRSQITQLTRDMYIFEETSFILYTMRERVREKSLV